MNSSFILGTRSSNGFKLNRGRNPFTTHWDMYWGQGTVSQQTNVTARGREEAHTKHCSFSIHKCAKSSNESVYLLNAAYLSL